MHCDVPKAIYHATLVNIGLLGSFTTTHPNKPVLFLTRSIVIGLNTFIFESDYIHLLRLHIILTFIKKSCALQMLLIERF